MDTVNEHFANLNIQASTGARHQANLEPDARAQQLVVVTNVPPHPAQTSGVMINTLGTQHQGLPDCIVKTIPQYTGPEDAIALSQTRRTLDGQLADDACVADITTAIHGKRISTLTTFEAMLAKISTLPIDLRGEPLYTLAQNIHTLPDEWRPDKDILPVQTLPDGDRKQAMTILGSTKLDLTGPRATDIANMIRAAKHESPEAAAAAGCHIPAIVQLYGLTEASDISRLEFFAACSLAPDSAGSAVLRGDDLQSVAARHGIITPDGIRYLDKFVPTVDVLGAAGRAVAQGEKVQDAAARCGITSPETIFELERLVLRCDGLLAVNRGDNVQQVVARYGITTAEGIATLENDAIHSTGPSTIGAAIKSRENMWSIVKRFGITGRHGIEHIREDRSQYQKAVRHEARRQGRSHPQLRHH